MKRLLLIVPLVLLLILLNACVGDTTAATPDPQQTAFAMWLTDVVSKWTPTPTPTIDPNVSPMVSWLNADLLTTNSIGSTIDADYHVNNIEFPNVPNSTDLIFRVDVGCTCMNTSDCCTPERTFVVIVETMKKFSGSVPPIPTGLTQMMVVCSNQQTKSQIGAISASWQNVSGYLWSNLDGHQLGVQITRTTAP